jgi:hypothetical protein
VSGTVTVLIELKGLLGSWPFQLGETFSLSIGSPSSPRQPLTRWTNFRDAERKNLGEKQPTKGSDISRIWQLFGRGFLPKSST